MTAVTPPRAFSMHLHPSQAQSWEDLIQSDTRPVPDKVRSFGEPAGVGPYEIPVRWYTDRNLYQVEIENIWKRKWQMACRTDHLAEVGDTYLYEIAGLSFIIVRASKDLIKGYWNSCLHRGTPLRQCSGRVDRLQCPFHGFTWGLDGKNLLIPHPDQFPHIDRDRFSLPEVQIGVWEDFVFINPDLQAESLESYMGELATQFTRLPFTGRQLNMHVRKVFAANWKALQEAFLESFHVLTTHPQSSLSGAADRCSSFGVSGNVSRGVVPAGQTNEYVSYTPTEQQIFQSMNEFWEDEEIDPDYILPEGMTARQAQADMVRARLEPLLGPMVEEVTDSEALDVFYYTLFPNFNPYGGVSIPLVYRFLPYGNDPNKAVMDLMFLTPLPEGVERQPPAEPVFLSEDQEFTEIKELGSFGSFVAQDSGNMRGIMKGLQNSQTGIVHFARDYESKIRHFYWLYQEAMGLSADEEVAVIKARRRPLT